MTNSSISKILAALFVSGFCFTGTAQALYGSSSSIEQTAREAAAKKRAGKDDKLGWVVIQSMLDEQGKTSESVIIQSGGDPAYKALALTENSSKTFDPILLDGKTQKSRFIHKLSSSKESEGVSSKFNFDYKKLQKAISKGKKKKADKHLKVLNEMNLVNLDEEAYLSIAQFSYDAKFEGSTESKISALTNAIAFEKEAKFLPEAMFNAALQQLYTLQLKSKLYGDALVTYDTLSNIKGNEEFVESMSETRDKIMALKESDAVYKTEATISKDGVWTTSLLKSGFALTDSTGNIDSIKVYCDNRFSELKYTANGEYKIPKKWGDCNVVLVAEPDVKLNVFQF